MKVLMVMTEGHGGMFQYGALLSNALAEKHEVTAIIPRGGDREFFNGLVKVIELSMGDTKANFLRNMLDVRKLIQLLKIIRQKCPHVVHFHNPYNPWTCPLLPFLRSYGIVVSIPEGKLHIGMENRIEMLLSKNLHLRFCDTAIVLCKYDEEIIKHVIRNKKIFIVPHGVNTVFLKYARADIAEENLILFFGNLAPFKGLAYLLKAFPLIKERVPDAKLIIAGTGKIDDYNELLKGLNDVIIDNRFISPEKVAEYFQLSKVVVIPTVERDHSGIIPIAYSFGKPVVASDMVADNVEDGKTGLVVPPRNAQALADAIIKILRNEELRKKIAENGLLRGRQKLNWGKLSERTLEAYKEAIKSKIKLAKQMIYDDMRALEDT